MRTLLLLKHIEKPEASAYTYLGSPMKRNLLRFVMRYGTIKEKNTELGEGLRWLAKESHGIRRKKKLKQTRKYDNMKLYECGSSVITISSFNDVIAAILVHRLL